MEIAKAKAKDVATLFGVSAQAVGNWARRDGCPRNQDGTFDCREVLKWFIDREAGAMTGGRSEALERYRQARASQEQLRLQQMRGELVPMAEINPWLCDRVIAAKAILMSIPAAAPALVAQDVQTIAEILEARVRAALETMAQEWEGSLSEGGDKDADVQ